MQLYNRRERFIKTETERKYWKELDYRYMSQESSEEDGESTFYNVHSFSWRSEGSDFIILFLNTLHYFFSTQ